MSFADFHFLRPWWLLTLVPAGFLWFYLLKNRLSRGNWLDVCDAELLPYLLEQHAVAEDKTKQLFALIASFIAIIALAGPTWQQLPSPAFRNNTALVIALDLSVSMDAGDIKPSRLGKARYKIADLLKQRKDGQTALLVYGGDAFTVTPLTTDTATITSQLEALNTEIMPSPGRNTGVAIRKAVSLLQQAGVVQGDILLITDGVETEAIKQAEKWLAGYRLSVLAIGTPEGAPIQQVGGFVKDAAGNIQLARLDEPALLALCQQGKGLFQLVNNDDQDVDSLQQFFDLASNQEQKQQRNVLLQQWQEVGPWLVLCLLPWAALQFRKGLFIWLTVLLLPWPRNSEAVDWQSLWQTPDQRAELAYRQQQYQQAAEQFTNPEWRAAAQYKAGEYQQSAETLKAPETADGFYNRGNALAKAGQLKEAVAAYQQALKLDSQHQDALYNKDLVEKKLKEQQQDQQQKSEQDSDKQQQNQDSQKSQDGQNAKQSSEQSQQSEDKSSSGKSSDSQHQEAKQDPGQAENQSEQKSDEDKSAEEQQAKSAKEQATQAKPDDSQPADAKKPAVNATEKSDLQRANEQLLKRIPDEPTGLLKRKFKYQYSQQDKTNSQPRW